MLIEFCKCHPWKGQPVRYLQPKLDGHHVIVSRIGGKFRVHTRTTLDIAGKLEFMSIYVPDNTILAGELHCPDEEATSVKTMINDKDPRLIFSPFAIPWYKGKDLRQEDLSTVGSIIAGLGYPALLTRRLRETPTVSHLRLEALSAGVEGWVLKNRHYAEWYKVKPRITVDCIVMRTVRSTADTQYGDLKACVVGVLENGRLQKVASVGTGYTKDFRAECNPADLVGKVMEVRCDGLAAAGMLKFPRFLRWREDKLPEDCTMEQLA